MTLHIGDVRDVLPTLESRSVQMCMTSPPYWGLRDYGVDGQLGLEKTPEEYVAKMVEVFREVRRVLKDDGIAFVNLEDSYWNGGGEKRDGGHGFVDGGKKKITAAAGSLLQRKSTTSWSLKPKDLIGIPWRVAFALQADGWVLRQEIIWSKPEPMPESVRDRCTKSHEQIFLFAKARWTGPDNGMFAHISDQDARWLACCIDTEGCIVVKRVKQADGGADSFAPQVSFGSTSKELIGEFVSIVGHGSALERPGKNAPMYYWQIANNVARDFLHRIYPYLLVKKRQAKLNIYLDSLTYYRGGKFLSRKQRTSDENNKLISMWERSKLLNQFGNPDMSDIPEPQYGRWANCERYRFDAEAIAERLATAAHAPGNRKLDASCNDHDQMSKVWGVNGLRNKSSVWTVNSEFYSDAHFATFPQKLIEPCILAGSRSGDTVLDPFFGSGTTGQVCERLGRKWVGIELNPEYGKIAKRRTAQQGFVF